MALTDNLLKQLKPLTDWWEDAGVPVDTRELEKLIRAANASAPKAKTSAPQQAIPQTRKAAKRITADEAARSAVANIRTLDELRTALEAFDGCELKLKAQSTVIADGPANADVMVIGEGPGREEDKSGKPFIGPAGQLLDKMLKAIGLSRDENAYLTNVNFWRPPGNRNPTPEELAICRPFVDKHIELVAPKLIIATGLVPASALLHSEETIGQMRGKRFNLDVPGLKQPVPVFPIFHPSFLLKRPAEKSKAWEDLLNIRKFMEESGIT
ncbi:uracil-DNA glycosylase [Ponticaulis koreensis]|uniref:uracil-DNA glycosylase n=1 Tax=Ponticaulis koreensis TaxID=1123045 RepID=UPI0003B45B13|nr:uracil-DNA glycosylase [Ponticaulis koreensis]